VRKSTIVMIGFAGLFGLLAVFLAQTWLKNQAEMRMRSLEANANRLRRRIPSLSPAGHCASATS
jgi:hypothetical protein